MRLSVCCLYVSFGDTSGIAWWKGISSLEIFISLYSVTVSQKQGKGASGCMERTTYKLLQTRTIRLADQRRRELLCLKQTKKKNLKGNCVFSNKFLVSFILKMYVNMKETQTFFLDESTIKLIMTCHFHVIVIVVKNFWTPSLYEIGWVLLFLLSIMHHPFFQTFSCTVACLSLVWRVIL